jgi:hypothetical protein
MIWQLVLIEENKNITLKLLLYCNVLFFTNNLCNHCHLKFFYFINVLVVSEKKVISFYRGCQEKPDFLNAILEDSQIRTYYLSCTTDLCNSGDGTGSTAETGSFGVNNRAGEVDYRFISSWDKGKPMIVPGIGGAPRILLPGCVNLLLLTAIFNILS